MLDHRTHSPEAIFKAMQMATLLAPVVSNFVPGREVLTFTLGPGDEDADLMLRDLPDGSGCRIEVGDRVIAVIAGLSANDIDESSIRFEFEE